MLMLILGGWKSIYMHAVIIRYYLRKCTAQRFCDIVDAGGSKTTPTFYKIGGYEPKLTQPKLCLIA